MTAGYSGSYAVNGTNLILPPTEGNWVVREEIGIDGNGRSIYPAVREFVMKWQLIPTAALRQLINAQLSVANTGTLVLDLPKWGDVDYIWYSYSGCLVKEPEVGKYFTDHVEDVTLIFTNIRT